MFDDRVSFSCRYDVHVTFWYGIPPWGPLFYIDTHTSVDISNDTTVYVPYTWIGI
jgi:hypothetical protein